MTRKHVEGEGTVEHVIRRTRDIILVEKGRAGVVEVARVNHDYLALAATARKWGLKVRSVDLTH